MSFSLYSSLEVLGFTQPTPPSPAANRRKIRDGGVNGKVGGGDLSIGPSHSGDRGSSSRIVEG